MSDDDNWPNCGNCKFWDEGNRVGISTSCRRFPPEAGGWIPANDGQMNYIRARYPETMMSDWCGEHKYRVEEIYE